MAERLPVAKTYKLYINGQFPRSESGRSYVVRDPSGNHIANMCQGSKKDGRDAVLAARKAGKAWAARAAYNRGQILYRIAEMLEGRKSQFRDELCAQGHTADGADKELSCAVDRLVYYAGWCDKYAALFGTINPVATSHFNFSVPEPMGVVASIVPQQSALIGLISIMAPAIAGGNTCVLVASYEKPLSAISFAEVLQVADLPAGVVNIITGHPDELLPVLSQHLDVNAFVLAEKDPQLKTLVQHNAADNVKRVICYEQSDWLSEKSESPYMIMDMQEIKTTWHPMETYGGSSAAY